MYYKITVNNFHLSMHRYSILKQHQCTCTTPCVYNGYLWDSWYIQHLPVHCTDQPNTRREHLLNCCSLYHQDIHYSYWPQTRCTDHSDTADSSSLPLHRMYPHYKAGWSWCYKTFLHHTLCRRKHRHHCCNILQHSLCTSHLLPHCRILGDSG